MHKLPDFDVELSQTISYIMGCPLARRAFSAPPFPCYVNIVRELVESLDRLADNCHMPEFTNHALPHVCSVIARTCAWGVADDWLEKISPQEAGYLLIALIIHDLGMLSQDPRDMPNERLLSSRKGMSDLPMWVRRSHVERLPKLTQRLLQQYINNPEINNHLKIIIQIAASHSYWPWEEKFNHVSADAQAVGMNLQRLRGLNAVVAVADLLDEDSGRCDTITLMSHKYGNILNKTHWIRHALTAEVEDVKRQAITIHFRKLHNPPPDFDIVYRVLRNHYRLVLLYSADLYHVDALISTVEFAQQKMEDMLDDATSREISLWTDNIDLKYCLTHRLLETFDEAAKNIGSTKNGMRQRLDEIGMESVNINPYSRFLLPHLPRTDEERIMFLMSE